jgi:DNA mismatch repair ATPase MutS
VQENIIRDFLLPLGLDTNHGYGKTPIVNSEVAKKRAALEKRLSNVERWMASAQERSHKASLLYNRLWKQTKAYGDELYRKLNAHQDALAAQGVDYYERRAQIKAEKAVIDAELEQRGPRVWRAYNRSNKESEKQHRYAHEHCDLLRALEDLAAKERTMYELDNRKDHVMTICKLALANLGMWVRDVRRVGAYGILAKDKGG